MAAPSLSVHSRIRAANLPTPASPSQVAAFLSVILDYTVHLRTVTPPQTRAGLIEEYRAAQRFVELIVDERVLPLAQQIAPEFRWPIEPEGKPWLLEEVLIKVRGRVTEPEMLLPVDNFWQWQREKFWNRILLNLEYLTFAWNKESEDDQKRLREARDGFERMMEVVDQVYRVDSSEHYATKIPRSDDEDEDEDEDEEVVLFDQGAGLGHPPVGEDEVAEE
ncbi:hypothetical protein AYL99_05181 [Fonsecaea erecta]|uniref:Uncharacterized protein n=1 Tax=Fonsecaea erecta TaxID=1367422 RepID=A0A178ZK52_9EURO|nr:hypothetical protein AYL99_05181 [Fonsecaea erecta]OAP60179.1 hypothetical protein AYL99_05181 [Fonsecaea erecta]